jgi:alpha-beta hydrolase superfamily lysophospholipase
MPSTYAREMAKRGYAALAFDFAGWGESAGRPRGIEDPLAKADDIVAAVDYLSSRADITVVGGLGICASSAYLATAATRTDKIASVVLVAPALQNHDTVIAALGGEAGVTTLTKIAADAQAHYAHTGEEQLVTAVQPNEKNTRPGADYYTNPARGLIPEWSNSYNPTAWPNWLAYDAQASATAPHRPQRVCRGPSERPRVRHTPPGIHRRDLAGPGNAVRLLRPARPSDDRRRRCCRALRANTHAPLDPTSSHALRPSSG